jgi:hypothetical protein
MTTKLINKELKDKKRTHIRTPSVKSGYSNKYPTRPKRRWSSTYFFSFFVTCYSSAKSSKRKEPIEPAKMIKSPITPH